MIDMTGDRDRDFEAYVAAERLMLLRIATLLTAGDTHAAEDIVQSALTRIYLAWPHFARADNPRAYTRRALANALADESRHPLQRREERRDELPGRPSAVHTESGDSTIDLLDDALTQLPPKMRAAIVFRNFHELSVSKPPQRFAAAKGPRKARQPEGWISSFQPAPRSCPPLGGHEWALSESFPQAPRQGGSTGVASDSHRANHPVSRVLPARSIASTPSAWPNSVDR